MGSEQKNALLAVILSGLILFGWQFYFAPQANPTKTGPIEPVSNSLPSSSTTSPETISGPIEPQGISEIFITSNNAEVIFTSELKVISFKNKQSAFEFSDIVGTKNPIFFEFDFGNGFESLNFVEQSSGKFFNEKYKLNLLVKFTENSLLPFEFSSENTFKYRVSFKSEPKKLENGQQRFYSFYNSELTQLDVGDEESGDKLIKWAGIDFNYHLFAFYLEKETNLLFTNSSDGLLRFFSSTSGKEAKFTLLFVKKEYDYLASLGHNLKHAVNFGMWGLFAEWILRGLQFFYKYIPNYGISIILLTFLIRLLTFPLQYKSFVSMKKLQLIQPELTKIRERFKDDPQKLQKESMDLFKKSGANPLGGCLPLILQMPVFFAFYKVLYSAVELVDARFYLWINDLSNKDPYYVLPVLMTGAMFLQQKLTPNTITDPVQKKVMMFMPLMFGFIMKDMPSGLSLYIFVSTLLGIVQQFLVFNSKNKNTPVVV
jgi:YidC/Oxa1 family membrane protein insertase